MPVKKSKSRCLQAEPHVDRSLGGRAQFLIVKTGMNDEYKGKGEPAEESPIEKLGRMIAGTWAIDATSESDEAGSKPGKDVGKSVIRFGPANLRSKTNARTATRVNGTRKLEMYDLSAF